MIRKFVKSSFWILSGNILTKVINFLTLGFLARVLNPNSLGYYNALQNTGNSINMMSSFGAPLVMQRTGAILKDLGTEPVSKIFSTCFTLYMIVNILAGVTLITFPKYFFDLLLDSNGKIDYVYYISVIVILNAINQIPMYLMLGLGEFKKYSIVNFFNSVFVLIASFIFIIWMQDNLVAAIYGLIFSYIANILLLGYLFRKILRKEQLKLNIALYPKVLKSIFSDGFLYYFGNTFLVAVSGLVTISLFYKHLTSLDYGFMRIGNAFAILFSLIPAALQPVTISLLAGAHERKDYIKSIQLRGIPFLSVLMLIFLSFNMELIIGVFFGESYLGAINIVFGMLLLQILNIYLGLINTFQIGLGNMNYIGIVASVTCLFLLACYFYFIPHFGIVGYFLSLYTATVLSLLLMVIKEYYKKKHLKLQDYFSICLVFLLSIISFLVVYYLPAYIKMIFSFVIISLAAIIFWRYCLHETERVIILEEVNKKRSRLGKVIK